jgi:trk system potassium uptake protein TrkA
MKDIAVIGLGIFGHEIAIQLQKKGNKVLAVDLNQSVIDHIKDLVTVAAKADITDEDALKELDIAKFDMVILGLGSNFEQLVLGITYLKRLGVKKIIARATTEIQQEVLLKVGADEVVLPEKQIAIHLAERITAPNILEYFELDEDVDIAEIRIDDNLTGRSLKDLNLRKKYNVTALLHIKESQKPKVITDPNEILTKDDQLIVVGKKEDIEKIFS